MTQPVKPLFAVCFACVGEKIGKKNSPQLRWRKNFCVKFGQNGTVVGGEKSVVPILCQVLRKA